MAIRHSAPDGDGPSGPMRRDTRVEVPSVSVLPGDVLLDHATLREIRRVAGPRPGGPANVAIWFADQPAGDGPGLQVPPDVSLRLHPRPGGDLP